jgi:hypothetical protein
MMRGRANIFDSGLVNAQVTQCFLQVTITERRQNRKEVKNVNRQHDLYSSI